MQKGPRIITRRFKTEVEFHQCDMMRVVHNSHYFKWFEKGRLQVLEDIFPMQWALDHKIATPVIMNHAEYLKSALYNDNIVITTRHPLADRWSGKFLFDHSVSNTKTKIELCRGQTSITVINFDSGRLLKEIPEDVWRRYQNLK